MIVSIKKRTILIIMGIVLGFASIVALISTSSNAAYSAARIGKTIVIDAGHGGIDGGVVGVNTGVKESDINLAIARSLKHFLQNKGYDVVMTRSSTDGLYGMATKNRKAKDMEARRKVIENAKPDLVVSIHQNSYPRALVKGAQVFYAPSSQISQTLATTMQNVINANLGFDKKAAKGDYFILQCSSYPSLLVECGFLSNAEEEKLLISAAYQEKVAYTIFTGIHAILSK